MDIKLTEQIAKDLCRHKRWEAPTFIAAGNSAAVFETKHPKLGAVALKIYDPSFFSGDNALIEEKRIRLQEKLRSHGNEYLIDVLEIGEIAEASTWFASMLRETLDNEFGGIRKGFRPQARWFQRLLFSNNIIELVVKFVIR
jgi:hypothetical protein